MQVQQPGLPASRDPGPIDRGTYTCAAPSTLATTASSQKRPQSKPLLDRAT
ncbi:MAG TPA: hypothetical protein VGF67_17330 [Ktedonobacteraceae bacterium]